MMATNSADTLRSAALTIMDELERKYARLEDRVDALESAQQIQVNVVAFSERRASWTPSQLADDLQVHVNIIRNYIALSQDHPRYLRSFQPGGSGPYFILPEHVADWIARNESRLPMD